jgi:hypothetical protein
VCTVSFVPYKKNKYILTFNRDEKVNRGRLVTFPNFLMHNQIRGWWPKDVQGEGSWIGFSNVRSVCLLNGGFEAHIHNPPYRKSRGKVLLEALYGEKPETFSNMIALDGIAPFRILWVEHTPKLSTFELVWTGTEKHFTSLLTEPWLRASATLYSQSIRETKKKALDNFLAGGLPNETQLREFHLQSGDSEDGWVIRRADDTHTVSLTQICWDGSTGSMSYWDLTANTPVYSKVTINNLISTEVNHFYFI